MVWMNQSVTNLLQREQDRHGRNRNFELALMHELLQTSQAELERRSTFSWRKPPVRAKRKRPGYLPSDSLPRPPPLAFDGGSSSETADLSDTNEYVVVAGCWTRVASKADYFDNRLDRDNSTTYAFRELVNLFMAPHGQLLAMDQSTGNPALVFCPHTKVRATHRLLFVHGPSL